MKKQEQIEEIEDIMNGCFNTRSAAVALYSAGYHKIPENAVVFTEEEYLDLSRNYVGEQIEATRKVTAKEFAEKLKEKALLHCKTINCYELKSIEETIDELLKV